MTAEQEAKQLDSVTDFVKEREMDESKAKTAMSQLSKQSSDNDTNKVSDIQKMNKIAVSKDDITIICSELEVSEDIAARALRQVIHDGLVNESTTALGEALRKLVTSS